MGIARIPLSRIPIHDDEAIAAAAAAAEEERAVSCQTSFPKGFILVLLITSASDSDFGLEFDEMPADSADSLEALCIHAMGVSATDFLQKSCLHRFVLSSFACLRQYSVMALT